LPKGFLPERKLVMNIHYETNIMAEVPRSFKVNLPAGSDPNRMKKEIVLKNNPPKFNDKRGCYTLNFFG
jgi:hypothetical protein